MSDSDTKAADRPLPTEIEITPAMIRAGATVVAEHYMGELGYDLRDPVLAEIFRAMYAAH
jgi:hypothetical protein